MSLVITWDNVNYIFVSKNYGQEIMGNPERQRQLGYDIVQRQANEKKTRKTER